MPSDLSRHAQEVLLPSLAYMIFAKMWYIALSMH